MSEAGGRRAPQWWAQLQQDFGDTLRTPLRVVDGRFEADSGAGSPALIEALTPAEAPAQAVRLEPRARLGVYQTQVWMRLFDTMQTAFPRLTHVLGPWRFNHLAQLHLVERPPADADLDRCADGFHDRLGRALACFGRPDEPAGGGYTVDETRLDALPIVQEGRADPYCRQLALARAPRTLVRQALSMDEAQRRAQQARAFRRWEPPSLDPARFGEHRLRFAPSFGLVREDWELAPLGYGVDERPKAAGAVVRHSSPRYWVFFRGPQTVGSRRIHPVLARLLTLAARRPFGDALAAVRRACRPEQAQILDERLPDWLALAAESGWWIGLRPS